jgi:hypothetical protein
LPSSSATDRASGRSWSTCAPDAHRQRAKDPAYLRATATSSSGCGHDGPDHPPDARRYSGVREEQPDAGQVDWVAPPWTVFGHRTRRVGAAPLRIRL